jgi:hypothetical protein
VTTKLFPGEEKYYSYKAKKDKALKFLVNVPNVVGYAVNKAECPQIDTEKCYDVNFNHHYPAYYEPTNDDTVLFLLKGLDTCEVTLTVL